MNPDPEVWEPDSKLAMAFYHPGAVYGIRSKKPNAHGAGEQIMYDGNGTPITEGLGAGTPDKVSIYSKGGTLGHRDADVLPFDWATMLDKRFAGGMKYRNMYLEVRPPSKGK